MNLASRVANIAVQVGDSVTEGQLLVEADANGINQELAATKERLQMATAGQAKALTTIEAQLRQARTELSQLQAGPDGLDRLAGQTGVETARASLQRAEADLVRLQSLPDPVEVRAAEQELISARLGVQKAEADLAMFRSGPDPFALNKAENDAATAQSALEKSQAYLNLLLQGSTDSLAVRDAERELERALIDLRTARKSSAPDHKEARTARDAAIQKLTITAQGAEDKLNALKTAPSPIELQSARRNVEIARRNVDDAQVRLSVVRQGPTPLSDATVQAAVDSARAGLAKAESRFQTLQAGPPPDMMAAAQAGVGGARTSLQLAEARLAELDKGRPGQAELVGQAQEKVATLEALLVAYQGGTPDSAGAATETGNSEALVAQRAVVQTQAALQALERDLAGSRLVAPAAGTVVGLPVRTGDPIRPGRPVVVLSKSDDRVFRAELPDRDAVRVVAGQAATVQVEGSQVKLDATVAAITEANGAKVALLDVAWPAMPAAFGTSAQAAIQVQRKEDALIVPAGAIRTLGGRRFVEVADGKSVRRIDVEIGLANAAGEVEVVSGLREGQQVVVAS